MTVRKKPPDGWKTVAAGDDGYATARWIGGTHVRVVASWGAGWDHVSVSTPNRCPTWDEMALVAREFFESDDTLMQLMVPKSDHVNCHPYCLHWWRPHDDSIPRPPAWMVGPKAGAP